MAEEQEFQNIRKTLKETYNVELKQHDYTVVSLAYQQEKTKQQLGYAKNKQEEAKPGSSNQAQLDAPPQRMVVQEDPFKLITLNDENVTTDWVTIVNRFLDECKLQNFKPDDYQKYFLNI